MPYKNPQDFERYQRLYRASRTKHDAHVKEWRAKVSKDKKLAATRAWQDRNREYTRSYAKAYVLRFREKVRLNMKRWRKANREKLREYARVYRAANIEREMERNKKAGALYRKRNPEKYLNQNRALRAARREHYRAIGRASSQRSRASLTDSYVKRLFYGLPSSPEMIKAKRAHMRVYRQLKGIR